MSILKKIVIWSLYWLFVAIALLAGLDNLVFQPRFPGLLIGSITLASTVLLLVRTKQWLINRR
jgi:hypothetical protein